MSESTDFSPEFPDAWDDDDNDAAGAAAQARTARRRPAARSVVPLGRLLAAACLMPILAMIVLGASRFDAIRTVAVRSVDHAFYTDDANDEAQAADGERLFSLSSADDPVRLVNAEDEIGRFDAGLGAPDDMLGEDLEDPAAMSELTPPSALTPARATTTQMMIVTAYCPCRKCCGKHAQGITASGKPVSYNNGRFVAADTRLWGFGTKLKIPGYHGEAVVEVIDRGGAIKGNKIDVYFPSHEAARKWGRQELPVEIIHAAEPSRPRTPAKSPLKSPPKSPAKSPAKTPRP